MVSLSVYRYSVIILCLVGISLSLYAFYVETRSTNDHSYRAACDIGERMSCSRVLTSRWGRGFGLFNADSPLNLPDSLFGFFYYCLSLILNRSYTSKTVARLRVFLSIITNLGTVYLGYILYFVLHDICVVCCGMYTVNFLLFICNLKLLTMASTNKLLSSYTQPASYNTSQTPSLHHLIIDPHSTGHVQQQQQQQQQQTQQQHSTTIANMALTAEREAYLRLAAHSMERSDQLAPHFNIRSPKAYGGYAVSNIIKIINKLNSLIRKIMKMFVVP
ncbi:unnamed protein product [Adineta steineri]|uniref:vitamin-K-epoxide reductase (warfarin-sensitive) n=1 Tax=Adineta steineri TaxID=433720 RepID=A0A814BWU7_9BILA|nr:unnamed protein product [Adineta steineri]